MKNLNAQFTRKSHVFQVGNSLKNITIILPKICILFTCTRLGSFNYVLSKEDISLTISDFFFKDP